MTSDGTPPPADAAELSLAERLLAARERKGVDLHRAERDTKIRARHLEALERGDYLALPGGVYTRGFLRSYAAYLGLDPDDLLGQWRRERDDVRAFQASAVPRPIAIPRPIPRPIAIPRRRLTFSHGGLRSAVLAAVVAVFAVYLGVQLLRFARPPTLTVTAPPVAIVSVEDGTTSYVLRGTSVAGATISVAAPGREQPYRVSAAADGTWAAEVDLRRGPNQFDVSASDPRTGKTGDNSARIFIRVPLPVFDSPAPPSDQPRQTNGS
jgi:transcriptional regulator with XRE-family HTH domain